MIVGARIGAAFLGRDWITERTYVVGFAFGVFGLIVDLLFYYFIGTVIDDAGVAGDFGLAGYYSFALVGVMLTYFSLPALSLFASNLREEQVAGSLEALFATPAPSRLVIVSAALFDLCRAAVLALIAVPVSMLLLDARFETSALGIVYAAVIVVLSMFIFGSVGVAVAAIGLVAKRGATSVIGLVGPALTILGGAYYPVSVLPGPLEVIARANPFTWATSAARAALLDNSLPVANLLGLLVVAALGVVIARTALGWAIDRARRDGSLTQF
jgi:ABC-2 type transport system permease protein